MHFENSRPETMTASTCDCFYECCAGSETNWWNYTLVTKKECFCTAFYRSSHTCWLSYSQKLDFILNVILRLFIVHLLSLFFLSWVALILFCKGHFQQGSSFGLRNGDGQTKSRSSSSTEAFSLLRFQSSLSQHTLSITII